MYTTIHNVKTTLRVRRACNYIQDKYHLYNREYPYMVNAVVLSYDNVCTPLAKYFYNINNEIIDFTESKKDLVVWVNSKFKWDPHQQNILNKAHQMLGITKRTCDFITDPNKRRLLYLSLVRS